MGANQRSQIVMTASEIAAHLERSRTATFATHDADRSIHLVAMWFAVVDGDVWFETKRRSQKAVNVRRDPTASVLIEDGTTYNRLRGVAMSGRAEVVDDPDILLTVGIDLWERHNGPYRAEMRPALKRMIHNRVAIRFRAERTRSWDHRKLGVPDAPPSPGASAFG